MNSCKQSLSSLLILALAGAATAAGQSCPGGLFVDPTGQLSPSAPGGRFGIAVAVDGLTAVVGDRNYGAEAGAAYVFDFGGDNWTQQARLTASDVASGDHCGTALAISGDTLVLGSAGDDELYAATGSAYVFVRSGSSWIQQARLNADDAANSDQFGLSVAIDGDTIAVGAMYDDTTRGSDVGSVYIFVRTLTTWTQQAKLTAGDGQPGDYFGRAVAVAGDSVLVGASSRYSDRGGAYVFVRNAGVWTQQALLLAGDAAGGDSFGYAVALDGDTALIGARAADLTGAADAGSAYVFVRSGGIWSQQAKLTASGAAASDRFGTAVALEGDTALIGADLDDAGAGAAYIFTRSGGVWTEREPKLGPGQVSAGNHFGVSVALRAGIAVVGAEYAGNGLAFAYDLFVDTDCDGIPDDVDNCPTVANAGQEDLDDDGIGDACDPDVDGDGVLNEVDNCPTTPNANQADADHDGLGDVCDPDIDGDGVLNGADNCPLEANADQADLDGDHIGDACDPDIDGDGVENDDDNCSLVANFPQDDLDADGVGDACDPDIDGDGVLNGVDNCPAVANQDQADLDGDGIGDACDPDMDNDTVPNAEDSAPRDRYRCSDVDADGCDDCSSGSDDPVHDGTDTDGDGICNLGDPDDDADGVLDADDPAPQNPFVCGDSDGDDCDDCNSGHFNPFEDGLDTDSDGMCDFGDTDDDGDGVPDEFDPDPTDNFICGDTDIDGCDDCSSGVFNALDDGPDFDGDGSCDTGDLDDDNDGLADTDELTAGTNPFDPDTDDDGLLDGAEVDIGTDPLNPDTDGDGLLDGSEVTAGTNPLNADTDDDGINDREDPWPLEPGVPPAYLVTECRETAAAIRAMDLSKFVGPTTNARKARRTALACGVTSAANCIAAHRYFMAAVELECVDLLIDGCSWPPDWMPPSAEKTSLKDVVELELELTMYLFD
jgi:hypothetical protein